MAPGRRDAEDGDGGGTSVGARTRSAMPGRDAARRELAEDRGRDRDADADAGADAATATSARSTESVSLTAETCDGAFEPERAQFGIPEESLHLCSVRLLELDGTLRKDVFSCRCPDQLACLEQRVIHADDSSSGHSANGTNSGRHIVEHGACVSASTSYCGAQMWPKLEFWQHFRLGDTVLGPILATNQAPLCHLSFRPTHENIYDPGIHNIFSCSCPGHFTCQRETFALTLDLSSTLKDEKIQDYYVSVGHCSAPSHVIESSLMLFLPFAFAGAIALLGFIIKALWNGTDLSNFDMPSFLGRLPGFQRVSRTDPDQGVELLSEACRGADAARSSRGQFERTSIDGERGATSHADVRVGLLESDSRRGRNERRRGDKPTRGRGGRDGEDDDGYDSTGSFDFYDDLDDGSFEDGYAPRRSRRRDRLSQNKQPELEVPLTVRYDE
ncbi:Hypothetical Protein FCC1311_105772 [Hondaea fermentalgiana]|uniref:Uncharacterized protein n=1 Tax=Hondaea fermentalgiana TaxID=2315210 RepID=A0A2R5H1W1_9STRA|nr:Hypothetical Protein FCC1311_105772 [Hondaea fermentalgiana]|eukprot:GBG34354.1 Hypothetical Protein FCC1311_105772 [Hondaea fermentalgiana]